MQYPRQTQAGTSYFGVALPLPTTAQQPAGDKTNQLCKETAPKELPSPFLPLFFTTFPFRLALPTSGPSGIPSPTGCGSPRAPVQLPTGEKRAAPPCFCKAMRYLWVLLASRYHGSAPKSPWAGVSEFSDWKATCEPAGRMNQDPSQSPKGFSPPPLNPKSLKLSCKHRNRKIARAEAKPVVTAFPSPPLRPFPPRRQALNRHPP